MKAMISQPMRGKTDEEIIEARNEALKVLGDKGLEVVNTYFDGFDDEDVEPTKNIPLSYLAASLECMSNCSVVYFCKDWENARGCRIEHEAAKAYGLEIIYE